VTGYDAADSAFVDNAEIAVGEEITFGADAIEMDATESSESANGDR